MASSAARRSTTDHPALSAAAPPLEVGDLPVVGGAFAIIRRRLAVASGLLAGGAGEVAFHLARFTIHDLVPHVVTEIAPGRFVVAFGRVAVSLTSRSPAFRWPGRALVASLFPAGTSVLILLHVKVVSERIGNEPFAAVLSRDRTRPAAVMTGQRVSTRQHRRRVISG